MGTLRTTEAPNPKVSARVKHANCQFIEGEALDLFGRDRLIAESTLVAWRYIKRAALKRHQANVRCPLMNYSCWRRFSSAQWLPKVSDGTSRTYLNCHFLLYRFTRYRRGGREQHVKPFDKRRVGQNRIP